MGIATLQICQTFVFLILEIQLHNFRIKTYAWLGSYLSLQPFSLLTTPQYKKTFINICFIFGSMKQTSVQASRLISAFWSHGKWRRTYTYAKKRWIEFDKNLLHETFWSSPAFFQIMRTKTIKIFICLTLLIKLSCSNHFVDESIVLITEGSYLLQNGVGTLFRQTSAPVSLQSAKFERSCLSQRSVDS